MEAEAHVLTTNARADVMERLPTSRGLHTPISIVKTRSISTPVLALAVHNQHLLLRQRPVLQTVLLVMGILTAAAVYVISLMGFVSQTLPVRADAQVAQK